MFSPSLGCGCEACPLGHTFGVGSRSSECFGCINMRSFLNSLLLVVSKGIKLTRNLLIRHEFASAEQSLCCFSVFAASLRDLERHSALARFSSTSARAPFRRTHPKMNHDPWLN